MYRTLFVLSSSCMFFSHAYADALPSSADISRINTTLPKIQPHRSSHVISNLDTIILPRTAPKDAATIQLKLSSITFKGNTVFTNAELDELYTPLKEKYITLADVYTLAEKITAQYKAKGYFLSRAYIPEQTIEGGVVHIAISEGHIGEVRLDKELQDNAIARKLIEKLKKVRPITVQALEETALRLGDLPGFKTKEVLYKLESPVDGAVGIEFNTQAINPHKVSMVMNNYGSKFIGPLQNTIIYEHSFYRNQYTQFAVLNTLPMDELKYGSVKHTISLPHNNELSLFLSDINARPGDSLKPRGIKSGATEISASLEQQFYRSKDKNLSFVESVGHKTLNSYILNSQSLTHDSIYTVQAGIKADAIDAWGGTNYVVATFIQGLDVLDASNRNEQFLSRENASPDFRKLEVTFERNQFIYPTINLTTRVEAQIASDNLFSSEEFSYGGQEYGKAYDSSDFTAKNGINGGLELSYYGWQESFAFPVVPFVFYDLGYLKGGQNNDNEMLISSTGLGTTVTLYPNAKIDTTLAWPLFEDISSPMYSSNRMPRLLMQLSYGF